MIFDLLFILVILASVVTLLTAVLNLLRGRWQQAIRLLAKCGVCLAIYLGVGIVVSLVSPQRVLGLGENRCSDDWCIAVDDVARSTSPSGAEYVVTFRMSSRARRVPQRENGVVVYLVDEKGRRYEVAPNPSAAPFNVVLQPGQAITTIRRFNVSGESGKLGVVVAREGSNSIPGRFIIGDDASLFHKPTIVRVQ
jgi:hypothetical protein